MMTLALPEFDSWLYDGGYDHIFQGSVCATDYMEDMMALALPEFDSWLYDGGDDHIFQGSVCATDVVKWDIEYE
ncbi:Hypp4929 [Branchiostoma lanceolatum]|uniref:Hypp4929 protein n=1 Tax=Branchiostoma lanceolatum TaxID=7740 RepID=A0A8K0F357_BRALA|nr:Hypp4929 [Branchiostoma lanceolatum]